jgi:F0F1-type ATP synthase gamma subunit
MINGQRGDKNECWVLCEGERGRCGGFNVSFRSEKMNLQHRRQKKKIYKENL